MARESLLSILLGKMNLRRSRIHLNHHPIKQFWEYSESQLVTAKASACETFAFLCKLIHPA